MMFGLIASLGAALFLTGLSAYLVLKRRTAGTAALSVALLLLAAIEVFDQLSLNVFIDPEAWKRTGLLMESFLPLSLLLLSLTLFRREPLRSLHPAWWALMSACLVFPVSVVVLHPGDFIYSPDLAEEGILFLGNAGYLFYTGVMLFCVLALVNLEVVFSATSGRERWSIKFEFIGIVSVLAVLIFYFSQGLLYRTINMNLIPVRAGVMVLAAVMIGYSRFFRGSRAQVAVSRYVIYRSLALLLVGAYLLVVGIVGGGLSYFGIALGRQITALFAFFVGALMLLVLFSENLRRRVRVFISKHFYAQKYDYREEWLKFTKRLASCRSSADVHMSVLATFQETFLIRRAALYLAAGEEGQFDLGTSLPENASLPQSAMLRGLCAYFTALGRVFNADHVEYVPAADEAEFVKQSGAKLIVPLMPNGAVIGLVVLGDQMTVYEYTYEDYDLMKTLAKQTALSVTNFRLSEELAETREVAAIGKVSSFVVHDLKNQAYSLSLTLENAREYIEDPDFQRDMLATVENTLLKMNTLIQKLRAMPETVNLEKTLSDLREVSEESLRDLPVRKKGIAVISGDAPVMCVVDPQEMGKVVLNLVINACDATSEAGTIEVCTGVNGKEGFIAVRDDGCGMAESFVREELFKPFKTTKKKGLGIGLYQCRQIVEAHGGRIEVTSEQGIGSTFTVRLPLASPDESRSA